MMMKAAVYLRVSSRDGRQDEANQEPDCARLCEARDWEPVWYRERESSVKDRPVWRSVLEAARVGQVRAVVVWSLDRIGRTRVQIAHDLAELFRWGAAVSSVRDPWLSEAGPFRDLLIQVMGWVAEGERQRLIERTHAGLARARAKGIKLGRKGKVVGPALEAAVALRLEGKSWREIHLEVERRRLGTFTRGAIERAVHRCLAAVGSGAITGGSQKGGPRATANPAPHAGLGGKPTGVSN